MARWYDPIRDKEFEIFKSPEGKEVTLRASDGNLVEEVAKKLREFKQSNDFAYGMPSDLQELNKMKESAENFFGNELEECEELYNEIKEKYKSSGYKELNGAVGKKVNPVQWKSLLVRYNTPAFNIESSFVWIKEFKVSLRKALERAEQSEAEAVAEKNKPKELSAFPDDVYSGSDISDIKQQMLQALMGGVIKKKEEVLAIAVTSGWKEGIYRDSKNTYRKIQGTVLFYDNDNDGVSRFTTYKYISNYINGEWGPLKFNSFTMSHLEGWADSGSGSMGSSANSGFFGTLIWFALALSNIFGGLIAGKAMLNKYHPFIEKMTSFLAPYSIQIGLVALAAGILGFVMSLLGLRLLSGIIPQATAVLLGVILAYDYIKANAKGKIQDQINNQQATIAQVNSYSQTIGLTGLAVGIFYLLFSGSFYFI